ncbi:MAG: cupin domain-containing protein [Anaerolineae bacterium]|nr:cupin domain-containing protein [Anaerolineae bacterium]
MPHIRRKDDVKPFAAEHGEVVYELSGHAAGGTSQHSVAYIELPPGKASLKHYHPVAEESYYCLSGTGRLVIDGEPYPLQPGACVALTPGQVHQLFNDGPETLCFLAVCAPAWTPDNSVYLD